MTIPKRAPDNSIVNLVDSLLSRAIARRASDVHFEPDENGVRVRYRIDGLLNNMDQLPPTVAENVVTRLKVLAGLLTYRVDVPQEGSFALNDPPDPSRLRLRGDPSKRIEQPGATTPIDIRVATFPTVRGERVAVRLLYQVGQVSALDDLGLSADLIAQLQSTAEQPQGLILITGPAGSGKSTTLYAIARHILTTMPGRSVVSLEDPVEQRINGMAQIQISPHGELDYVRAMRSLLRQDVQVLLVGEIRDAETAHVVVEAALTGHLIMSTMHSGDPAETIVRLLEMGIAPYQLVGALTLICSQRLLRTVCPTCHGDMKSEISDLKSEILDLKSQIPSCDLCAGTGYSGRTACGQIAPMNEILRQAILNHSPAGELRRLIRQSGPDLIADASRLLNAGKTTITEIQRVLGGC